jgi:hypothetical protein
MAFCSIFYGTLLCAIVAYYSIIMAKLFDAFFIGCPSVVSFLHLVSGALYNLAHLFFCAFVPYVHVRRSPR